MKKYKILNQEKTIFGIIKEIDDDDNSAVAIVTDGDHYIVKMNKLGKKLLYEIDCRVEVTGSIKSDPDGTNRITVNSFKVFDPEDDFPDGYDYDYDDYCVDEVD